MRWLGRRTVPLHGFEVRYGDSAKRTHKSGSCVGPQESSERRRDHLKHPFTIKVRFIGRGCGGHGRCLKGAEVPMMDVDDEGAEDAEGADDDEGAEDAEVADEVEREDAEVQRTRRRKRTTPKAAVCLPPLPERGLHTPCSRERSRRVRWRSDLQSSPPSAALSSTSTPTMLASHKRWYHWRPRWRPAAWCAWDEQR